MHFTVKLINFVSVTNFQGMKSTINSPTVNVVIQLFNQLGKADRMKVAERIGKQTLAERWDAMDAILPDESLSEADIMQEVSAVRYGDVKKS